MSARQAFTLRDVHVRHFILHNEPCDRDSGRIRTSASQREPSTMVVRPPMNGSATLRWRSVSVSGGSRNKHPTRLWQLCSHPPALSCRREQHGAKYTRPPPRPPTSTSDNRLARVAFNSGNLVDRMIGKSTSRHVLGRLGSEKIHRLNGKPRAPRRRQRRLCSASNSFLDLPLVREWQWFRFYQDWKLCRCSNCRSKC